MFGLKLVEWASADESVVFRERVLQGVVPLSPPLLRADNIPAQFAYVNVVVAVDNDIRSHGRLGGLDLEVPYREAFSRVDFEEIGARLRGQQL